MVIQQKLCLFFLARQLLVIQQKLWLLEINTFVISNVDCNLFLARQLVWSSPEASRLFQVDCSKLIVSSHTHTVDTYNHTHSGIVLQ